MSTAAFITAVVLGSLWGQRGLDDAALAPDVDGVLVIALVAGVLLGVAEEVAAPGAPPGSALADQRGLTVRGPLGFPAYTVPLAEIAAVEVVRVSALGEYGGWAGGSGGGSGSGRCSAAARRCR